MTAKLECVRLTNDGYQACFDRKKYNYSFFKYGSIAKNIAEQSLSERKRLKNYIVTHDNETVMYIWSAKLQTVNKVLIDKEDIEKLQKAKWFIEVPQNSRTNYVASDKYGKLHRYILGVKSGDKRVVDHMDRNGLNNKKENLRLVSNSLNKRNSNPRATNTFKQNGISYEYSHGVKYVRASWMENDGKVHSKKYSTKKYKNAVELAILHRREKEKELGYIN